MALYIKRFSFGLIQSNVLPAGCNTNFGKFRLEREVQTSCYSVQFFYYVFLFWKRIIQV